MSNNRFGGLSDSFVTLQNAIVFPHTQDNTCGVLDSDGAFCDFSRGVMGPRRAALEPQPLDPGTAPVLQGCYLYGGWLRAHFGHFLLESTTRFWALDELADRVDGIIFTQFRSGGVRQARKRYAPFLNILSGGKPLRILRDPTRVENLIVADPGFGHHSRITGSPRYRQYTRAKVAQAVNPEGPERLYVSRSALADNRGGIFGEPVIEEIMRANGYAIFHPQDHSIPDQLAHYRAARELVCLDGSALHLTAYALQPGARVGMILRRHSALLEGLAKQLELFADAKVHVFDALRASWVDESAKRVDFRSIGELDFGKLRALLIENEFIADVPAIDPLQEPDIQNILQSMNRGEMRRVPVATTP
ncbi:glycosyltransferase family 61 protein [uncultured Roseobacter sp.]|uniref:glycosyltransferase family 61 protein n=1 Tax=uncultured Roseobacter sp. TaxID=114847 RepID=UPI002621A266|nr:glycosyltransferase family 61 protein [uncultured Roseobacter sp.]